MTSWNRIMTAAVSAGQAWVTGGEPWVVGAGEAVGVSVLCIIFREGELWTIEGKVGLPPRGCPSLGRGAGFSEA